MSSFVKKMVPFAMLAVMAVGAKAQKTSFSPTAKTMVNSGKSFADSLRKDPRFDESRYQLNGTDFRLDDITRTTHNGKKAFQIHYTNSRITQENAMKTDLVDGVYYNDIRGDSNPDKVLSKGDSTLAEKLTIQQSRKNKKNAGYALQQLVISYDKASPNQLTFEMRNLDNNGYPVQSESAPAGGNFKITQTYKNKTEANNEKIRLFSTASFDSSIASRQSVIDEVNEMKQAMLDAEQQQIMQQQLDQQRAEQKKAAEVTVNQRKYKDVVTGDPRFDTDLLVVKDTDLKMVGLTATDKNGKVFKIEYADQGKLDEKGSYSRNFSTTLLQDDGDGIPSGKKDKKIGAGFEVDIRSSAKEPLRILDVSYNISQPNVLTYTRSTIDVHGRNVDDKSAPEGGNYVVDKKFENEAAAKAAFAKMSEAANSAKSDDASRRGLIKGVDKEALTIFKAEAEAQLASDKVKAQQAELQRLNDIRNLNKGPGRTN